MSARRSGGSAKMRPLRTSEFEHWHRVSLLAMVASIIGVTVDSRPEKPRGYCQTLPPARRQSCLMPLGFDPPLPGGMTENSPTFERWVREFRGAQVPKGRRDPPAVPPGLIVLRALVPNVETLGYYHMSLRDKDLARFRG